MNVPLTKDTLYNKLPPTLDHDLDMGTLMNASCIKKLLQSERSNLDLLKGGTAFNLLKIIDNGIFLCLCSVQDYVNGEYHKENHAFVYNSHYRNQDEQNCIGAIIDNRFMKPIRLIEEEDRIDKNTARIVFDDFFNAQTIIQHVCLVTKK